MLLSTKIRLSQSVLTGTVCSRSRINLLLEACGLHGGIYNGGESCRCFIEPPTISPLQTLLTLLWPHAYSGLEEGIFYWQIEGNEYLIHNSRHRRGDNRAIKRQPGADYIRLPHDRTEGHDYRVQPGRRDRDGPGVGEHRLPHV